MMKVKKYLSAAVIGFSLISLPFVSCDKDDEKSDAYKAGEASGEKFCNCIDTVSDPAGWGALECGFLISFDALQYISPSDTTEFANGFAAGSATCTE